MPPIELPLLFRIITGFLLVMQTLSRLWMTRNKPLSENSRFSHRSREQFFIRLTGGAMMFAYLYAILPDSSSLDFMLPGLLRWTGAALMLGGNILFILAYLHLGKLWSPELEIQPGHRLVIRGIYRLIRHPMYTGFLIFGLGLILLSANLFGCVYLPAVTAMIITRLPSEEQLLTEEFGEEYLDYKSKTSALIPGIF
jgi:protein-S-isoprenylcysteine O-methyltransferase Ste14